MAKSVNYTFLPISQDDITDVEKEVGITSSFEIYMTAEQWMSWYDKLCQVVGGVATLGAGFTFTVIVSGLAEPDPDHPSPAKISHVRFCLALSWVLFVLSLAFASFAALLFSANRRWFSDDLKRSNMLQVYRDKMWQKWEKLDDPEKTKRVTWLRDNMKDIRASKDRTNATKKGPKLKKKAPQLRKRYFAIDGEPEYLWIKTPQGFLSATVVLVMQLLPLSAFLASAEVVRAYEVTLGWIIIGLIILIALILIVFWLAQNK